MKTKIFKLIIFTYLFLFLFLIFNKVSKYDHNFSSLLNIWQGFEKLNSGYFEKNSIIFDSQGYDGQFFYLIAKYLFNTENLVIPKLDSFALRFSRISLPFIAGFFSSIFSFEYYSQISLTILILFHILSISIFYFYEKNLIKTSLLLFSPYTLCSNFLLLTDGLLASFIILFYIQNKKDSNSFLSKIIYFIFSICILFSKEVGILIVGYYFLESFLKKKILNKNLIILALLSYLTFKLKLDFITKSSLSTNELSFIQLMDFPFFGFFKSFSLENFTFKIFPKILLKIILLFSLFLMIPFQKKLKIESIPLYFLSLIIIISEQGYWYNMDNLLRLFTLIYTWYILIKKELTQAFIKTNSLIIIIVIIKIANYKLAIYHILK